MTTSHMGRRYIEEARGRVELVRFAWERGLWATVVREAQESVELSLKGALRLGAVEPAWEVHVTGRGALPLRRDFLLLPWRTEVTEATATFDLAERRVELQVNGMTKELVLPV